MRKLKRVEFTTYRNFNAFIHDELVDYMAESGTTLAHIEKKSGVSRVSIKNLRDGANLSVDKLVSLASTINIEIEFVAVKKG